MDSTRSTLASAADRTLSLWRPRYQRQLTEEDGRQILRNATGFFAVLAQWSKAEKPAAPAASDHCEAHDER